MSEFKVVMNNQNTFEVIGDKEELSRLLKQGYEQMGDFNIGYSEDGLLTDILSLNEYLDTMDGEKK